MDAVMRKYEETLGNSRNVLNPEEKNAVHVVHEYLESFHKTTTNICTSKVPTVGLVLFFMDHILEMIVACRDSRHIPNWLKLDADEMEKKARTYNNQVRLLASFHCFYSNLVSRAILMSPRPVNWERLVQFSNCEWLSQSLQRPVNWFDLTREFDVLSIFQKFRDIGHKNISVCILANVL